MLHEHNALIDALGGHEALAESLESIALDAPNSEAVRKWRRNGVPWRWRLMVEELAKRQRVRLPQGFRPEKRAA